MAKSELIQVGEKISKISATTESKTLRHVTAMTTLMVLEILDLPDSDEKQIELFNSTMNKYDLSKRSVTMFTGDNLADNQDVAPRVDKTKVYVLERIT